MSDLERYLTDVAVAEVTNGRWLIQPESGWRANGICVALPWFKPGQLLVARGNRQKGFLPEPSLKSLALQGASGIICEREAGLGKLGLPLLHVKNVKHAVLALGRYARSLFPGKVIGITGSAGKTTMVSMMAHLLESVGPVGATQGSANLPVGIAWNLAGMPQGADCWVVEMAVGQMQTSSDMVVADIAIVTNVGPAHLEFHETVESIAEKKARIFSSMEPGSSAVLCRDMEHYEIFFRVAQARGLQIVSYGCHPEADFVLRDYVPGRVTAEFGGRPIEFPLKAQGRHMALNALGVLAAAYLVGNDPYLLGQRVASFCPVEGRGNVFGVIYDGKTLSVIDESYNANPLSMKFALDSLAESSWSPSSRVLVLGDMLELGQEAKNYHEALLPAVLGARPDRILLCGPLMQSLWRKLEPWFSGNDSQGRWFGGVDELKAELGAWLRQGDVVFVKGSHSTKLRSIVRLLRSQ